MKEITENLPNKELLSLWKKLSLITNKSMEIYLITQILEELIKRSIKKEK
jgi:hypothetical protein